MWPTLAFRRKISKLQTFYNAVRNLTVLTTNAIQIISSMSISFTRNSSLKYYYHSMHHATPIHISLTIQLTIYVQYLAISS